MCNCTLTCNVTSHLSKNLPRTVFLKDVSSSLSSSSSVSALAPVFREQRITEFTCFLNVALSTSISVTIFLNSSSLFLFSPPLFMSTERDSSLTVTEFSMSCARSCACTHQKTIGLKRDSILYRRGVDTFQASYFCNLCSYR